jgi:16S rRNA (cytosine967-C5)-methyltransferase
MNSRKTALEIIMEVLENGRMSGEVIDEALRKKTKDANVTDELAALSEKSFVLRLVKMTIERAVTLDFIIERKTDMAVKKMKPEIRSILRLSVCQLYYFDNRKEAVVDEAVNLSKDYYQGGFSGYVNAVLRNISENRPDVELLIKNYQPVKRASIRYSMPEWITQHFFDEYGEKRTNRIFKEFLSQKDLCVRFCEKNLKKPVIEKTQNRNIQLCGIEAYMKLLKEAGIESRRGKYARDCLYIKNLKTIESLPGYKEGVFTVQDESSQLAVLVSGVKPGDNVLDVCAAPGGKTMYIACLAAEGSVTARDVNQDKCGRIIANLERMGIGNGHSADGFAEVKVQVRDALTENKDDFEKYDAVFADLPCSGLGIIGRKPDIKYRLKQQDLHELALLQKKILSIVSGYVKKGGTLIFSTCTLNREENEMNSEYLVKELGLVPYDLSQCLPDYLKQTDGAKDGHIRLEPDKTGTDGFYISRYIK